VDERRGGGEVGLGVVAEGVVVVVTLAEPVQLAAVQLKAASLVGCPF